MENLATFSFGIEQGGRQKFLGGGRYSEVLHIGTDMGKCVGHASGRYWKEAANQRWLL